MSWKFQYRKRCGRGDRSRYITITRREIILHLLFDFWNLSSPKKLPDVPDFYRIVSLSRIPLKLYFRAYRKFRHEIAKAGGLATQSSGVVDARFRQHHCARRARQ